MKTIVTMLSLLLLCGCAMQQPIPPEVISNADYGAPPPKNYEKMMKEYFSHVLTDPTAPIYSFKKPRKSYIEATPVLEMRQQFGWIVCGTVNSKNRFGGYVGQRPFFMLFKNGNIVEFRSGEESGGLYASLVNRVIGQACSSLVF